MMYSGEELFDDDGNDEDEDDGGGVATSFLIGALEAAGGLLVFAVIGAVAGTELESSPWFWLAVLALASGLGMALLLRRTRNAERLMFDARE
jgi:hypothetical protein